jgi:hypothetical protein
LVLALSATPGSGLVDMYEWAFFGAFLTIPYLGMLIGIAAVASWRGALATVVVILLGMAGLWALWFAGFQFDNMHPRLAKAYLVFISSGVTIGTVIYAFFMVWYYERTHEF